jgi:hypothetical protein
MFFSFEGPEMFGTRILRMIAVSFLSAAILLLPSCATPERRISGLCKSRGRHHQKQYVNHKGHRHVRLCTQCKDE